MSNAVERALRSVLPESLFSDEAIRSNASCIISPPRESTVRVNTLFDGGGSTGTTTSALEALKDVLVRQDVRYLPYPHPNLPDVIQIPSIGPREVFPAERRIIVSVECGQAVLRGAHVFAAGVLAIEEAPSKTSDQPSNCHSPPGEEERGGNVSVWADLDKKCTHGMRKRYCGRARFIGNGTLLIEREALFGGSCKGGGQSATGVAVIMAEMKWMMPSFDELPSVQFYPQNLPSILAVDALDARPGMMILDMCASPGGKTSHIAARMHNSGTIIAVDKNNSKVAKLTRTLHRLGVTCAVPIVADSTRLLSSNHQKADGTSLFTPDSFDRILLDPPCSGLGQRPLIVLDGADDFNSSSCGNEFSPMLSGYASYQKKLMDVAVRLLKPGGLLIYSTCTICPEENEGVVAFALENYPLKLEPYQVPCSEAAQALYPHPFGGLPLFGLSPDNASHLQRFWPDGPLDSIAFFFACLRKESSA